MSRRTTALATRASESGKAAAVDDDEFAIAVLLKIILTDEG